MITQWQTPPAPSSRCLLPQPLEVADNFVCLAADQVPQVLKPDPRCATRALPSPLEHFAASAEFSRTRVAILMSEGCAMHWPGYNEGRLELFASSLTDPVGTFLRNGYLVVASAAECPCLRHERVPRGAARGNATAR